MGHRIGRLSVALCLSIGLALPAAGVATAQPATAAAPSLVGKWKIEGGIFRFYRSASNTYTDKVIKQRTGVVCPSVNDKNKQIVVHKKRAGYYTGTWKWFYGSCTFAGYGATTITVASNGKTARLVSHPPKGTDGTVERIRLTRST